MSEDNFFGVSLEELSNATSPFHVDVCSFDTDRIIEAYPTMIIDEMMTEFNQQNNEYIAKQCVHLNIDKDILVKQTEELNRLNNDVQKLCNKAYQQGRNDAIDEILSMIKALGSSKRIMDIVYRAEQIKENKNVD